jgi:hypothetical protein
LSNLIDISLSEASIAVDVELRLISSALNFSGDGECIQNVDSSVSIEISCDAGWLLRFLTIQCKQQHAGGCHGRADNGESPSPVRPGSYRECLMEMSLSIRKNCSINRRGNFQSGAVSALQFRRQTRWQFRKIIKFFRIQDDWNIPAFRIDLPLGTVKSRLHQAILAARQLSGMMDAG